jgi:hypothetical protein
VGLGAAVVVLVIICLRLARRARRAASDTGKPARVPIVPQPRNPGLPLPKAWARETVPPPTANVAVVTLYELWMRRIEKEKLGARGDLWADLSDTPQFGDWEQLAEARGVSIGQNGTRRAGVQQYMTRGLLPEVLYAAGGVERELRDLRRAVGSKEQPAGDGPASALIAARPLRDASYSFVNLISWVRLTVDHTDRPYRPGLSARTGLLPALRPGELQDCIEVAVRRLRSALLDSRARSGYAFHAAAIPGAGTPGPQMISEERDMLAYATDLMAAIEVFVNQVLDAFAASQSAAPSPSGGAKAAEPSARGTAAVSS